MIWLYTGTPGSGKSLHAAKDIYARLKRRKGGLICNFPVAEKFIPGGYAYQYLDNSELTVDKLVRFAKNNHRVGVEGQTLIVIDECQILFNCRTFGKSDRSDWVKFFSQHRKLGYNVIMITQDDRMLDKQIRALVEFEVRHRKLLNYGFGGKMLSFLSFGAVWFIAIEYWYGGNRLKLNQEMFVYRKKYAELYDSYALFDDEKQTKKKKMSVKRVTAPTVPGGTRVAAPCLDTIEIIG